MPKRIRDYPIYLAPDIIGNRVDGRPIVRDHRTNSNLNPFSVDDKINIYERQVNGWFLEPANTLSTQNNPGFNNKSFIVLMICLSYLEGVQQYRIGQSSFRHSRLFFCN